jgi:hypothetical protein
MVTAFCLSIARAGAFLAGVPVMPLLLDYTRNRRFNPGWGIVHSVPWHFVRLLTQFCNFLDMEALPVSTAGPGADSPGGRSCRPAHLGVPQNACQCILGGIQVARVHRMAMPSITEMNVCLVLFTLT